MTTKKGHKEYTEKQKKLIKLIWENMGNLGKTKTMYQLLLEAGYSKATAREQSGILKGIKNKTQDIVKRLESERDEILKRMEKTRNKAKYKDLVGALDKVIKSAELLSDNTTENLKVNIVRYSDKKVGKGWKNH